MTTQTDRAIIAMQARLNAFNAHPFTPSQWAVQTMVAIADEQAAGAREQEAIREEARQTRRAERFMVAEAEARRRRALYAI